MSVGDDDDDLDTRRSCSYPFPPFSDALPRLSFSYHKLPPQLIKLCVVKLDSSSFDVQVNGNATVGELKEAIEDVFIKSPEHGARPISWSHVWGHFCLCYEDQKLINDKDYIRNFGIKDGDKLHFIRHLSINYMKRIPRRERVTCKEPPLSRAGSNISIQEEGSDDYDYNDQHDEMSSISRKEEGIDGCICIDEHEEGSGSDQDDKDDNGGCHNEDSIYYNHDRDEDFIAQQEFKLAHYLKGWLSYSTLWFSGKTKGECKIRSSKFSGQFLKLGSKVRLTSL